MPDASPQEPQYSDSKDATVMLAANVKSSSLDYDAFCKALDNGADPNWRDNKGTPLLNLLAAKGHTAAIGAALEAGADINNTDSHGNTALFEAYLAEPLLTLLCAGLSPSHKNNQGYRASTYLPLNHTLSSYRPIVVQSSHMLRDCEELERASEAGRLSTTAWENIWPKNSHGYPPPVSVVPSNDTAVYFMHLMEKEGKTIDKDYIYKQNTGAAGLRNSINHSEIVAKKWRSHQDDCGQSMTTADWEKTGIFRTMSRDGKISCLLGADYWAHKENLEGFTDLLEALPQAAWETNSTRLENTIANTLATWVSEGEGKNLSSSGLSRFRNALPEKAQELFSSYHMLHYERRSQEQSSNIGR